MKTVQSFSFQSRVGRIKELFQVIINDCEKIPTANIIMESIRVIIDNIETHLHNQNMNNHSGKVWSYVKKSNWDEIQLTF